MTNLGLLVLKRGNGLALDSTLLIFLLDLVGITDSREEVRLSSSVRVEGGKPAVPLGLVSSSFLHVANHREFQTGEETIVGNVIVVPTVGCSSNIVARLGDKLGSIFQILFRKSNHFR